MIQRFQTLWLSLVVVCGILLAIFPPMQFMTPAEAVQQQAYEIRFANLVNTTTPTQEAEMTVWPLAVLAVVMSVLALVIIFLYKRRVVQARLCVVNIVLAVGYYLVLIFYTWTVCVSFSVSWYLNVWAALPLVIIVLSFMSIRYILKDEALVRAANRLR